METQKRNIAVVILNWNGQKWLEKFLPTVIEKSSMANIYIADNASTDNSISIIEDNFPGVKIIQNQLNEGYAKGYNDALNGLKEKYFVLLNSDIEVTDNWIEPIINLMKENPNISACQPKILNYNDKDSFEYAGASGGYIDILGYPFTRGRIFDEIEADNNQYNDIKEIFWASGACLFVRAEHFNEVNGFDNDFFAHQEEIDLCWRLKIKGYQVMVCPDSVVYHVGGGTLDDSSPFKTYLNFRNNLFMLTKNLNFFSLLITLYFRLPLDGIAALTLLKKKNGFWHLFAVLRAHLVFYVSIPSLIFKRQKNTTKTNLVGKMGFSILRKYYLERKRKFSEL
ncbi:glycosyltransferase family 2 protein [Flavobacteriales bacterium]|nr:glycosyltransferase family 2 protein [Flavobacteriales bacterium]